MPELLFRCPWKRAPISTLEGGQAEGVGAGQRAGTLSLCLPAAEAVHSERERVGWAHSFRAPVRHLLPPLLWAAAGRHVMAGVGGRATPVASRARERRERRDQSPTVPLEGTPSDLKTSL